MTKQEAVSFLQSHQPMPSDWDITDEQGEAYSDIIDYFAAHPDPVCIPLFLNSLSKHTGLGMYFTLERVFSQFQQTELTPHLLGMLRSQDRGKHSWAVHYALTSPDAEMIEPLASILQSPHDEDAHYLTLATLEAIWEKSGNASALEPIRQHSRIVHDEETHQLIQEIMSRTTGVLESD